MTNCIVTEDRHCSLLRPKSPLWFCWLYDQVQCFLWWAKHWLCCLWWNEC